ncbi:hypothetical protein JW948_13225 [bacterium]|nr:hypothetical protein [bacterium]
MRCLDVNASSIIHALESNGFVTRILSVSRVQESINQICLLHSQQMFDDCKLLSRNLEILIRLTA